MADDGVENSRNDFRVMLMVRDIRRSLLPLHFVATTHRSTVR